ncbi:DUF885 domain-containing protein [Duganella sp. BJB488]|uniref:DUF885 domain-containing protein n=1 Tax=unclassified Duganella TaxID=2636909 RepID=UPI000E3452BC|nr:MULTISPECIES: DUF885 domain-containing protein [unclassified Duganella]RFP14070.1 DUF885 domain-containing protein [Duganella sp. BJB489]RFP17346.1 DUF885 domain-containing protein [Duganella sp. BJB488]RFP31864.1 DUF885 domain-containing protein [Duganella sp. BJB480]
MPSARPLAALTTTTLIAALLMGAPPVLAAAKPASTQQAGQAQKQLARLAAAFHTARCKYDPLLFATANGDGRYDDQLGMSISPKVRAAQFALYRQMQKQLMTVHRDQLGQQDQLTYDLLSYELNNALQLESFPEHLLPLNQFDNVPSTLANYADGTGSQPLGTVKQYQAYLSRLNQLPAWIDQAIANMKQGMRSGVVQPKAITVAMLPQFQNLRAETPETSIYYSPVTRFPAGFSEADQRKLTAAYLHAVEGGIAPALNRLVSFLQNEYLPASRASSGWSALPNGAAWYAARIKDSTNLPLTPDAVHALGLKEVARIQQQLAALGPKLGYDGPEKQLPQWVAAQDKFKIFTTDEQVLDAYRAIYATVQTKLPTYFSLVPKAKLELHLEPELTRATASDHYTPSAADGSHPGVFWPVVNDPKKYSRVDMVSLFLHEGVPGHHLHAALLKELDLPDFRKFSTENPNSAAYTEGWALYSETLGREMGLYEDPVAYYGHLNAEMLRAARLVVDTGLHAKGWSREQAIAYLADTLGWSEARARNQIERYMVWPAQALSYKIGSLKILELRARAQATLGDKFSYQKFHEVVIGDGTLPLPILEARVDRWIAK